MISTDLRIIFRATVLAATLLIACGFSIGSQSLPSNDVKCWRLRTSGLDVCTVNGWFKVLTDRRQLHGDTYTSSELSPQILGQLLEGEQNLGTASVILDDKKETKEKRKFDSISYNNGMGGF